MPVIEEEAKMADATAITLTDRIIMTDNWSATSVIPYGAFHAPVSRTRGLFVNTK